MSLETIPTEGVRDFPPPESTSPEVGVSVRYNLQRPRRIFNVTVPKSPPERLLLNVEAEVEEGAVFVRAIEVDVAVEGDTPEQALQSLVRNITGWLEYLQEEQPALASDLEPQRRYVGLLRYHPLTWFKSIRIS